MSINSPCLRLCQLDDADVCVGCFRTRAEIAAWLGMNDAARSAVVAQLDERRKAITLEAEPPPE